MTSQIVQFVQHQARRKLLLDRLDIASADLKQSIAFVQKMIGTKKSQIVQLQTDCAAEMVLDSGADVDVRNSLCMKVNEYLQLKGSARADAWTQTTRPINTQPSNPQSTNAQPNAGPST